MKCFHRVWVWASATVLLTTVWEAPGQYRILFLGNSFTVADSDDSQRTRALGGVPGIFDRLAKAGGHTNVSVIMRAVGGKDFEFHATDPTSQSAINSQKWDFVNMHSFSTEPTHFVDGIHSIADFMTYGENLYRRIMTNHPTTKILLQETWSRAVGHPYITGISTPISFASTADFQNQLRTNYAQLSAYFTAAYPTNPPTIVSPVGSAWENAGGLLSSNAPGYINLFASDLWHGNDNGHYLSAAVAYCMIYRESPVGLSTNPIVASMNLLLTVPPDYLETIAWATVRNQALGDTIPAVQEPLVFLTQPASATVQESQPATFKAVVLGSPPYFITWTSNGIPIAGAEDFALTIPKPTLAMNGTVFAVTVSNLAYQAVSTNAVLQVTPRPMEIPVVEMLFDFGGPNMTVLGAPPDDPRRQWNNLTTAIGTSTTGVLTNVVTASNQTTSVSLAILDRFANVNETGTLAFPGLPQDATRDSLYGNTEFYSGLSNVFPRFKLTGLDQRLRYRFAFYASRMGVTDNRETFYTVAGRDTAFAALDAANNITNVARVAGVRPTAAGEIVVSLGPTTNNNNAYHFTYLGAMSVTAIPAFLPVTVTNGVLQLEWAASGQLEAAPGPGGPWNRVLPPPLSRYSEPIITGSNRFFRLVIQN